MKIWHGDREVEFDVTFTPLEGQKEDDEFSEIVIKGYSSSVETGKVANVVAKKNFKIQDRYIFLYLVPNSPKSTASRAKSSSTRIFPSV